MNPSFVGSDIPYPMKINNSQKLYFPFNNDTRRVYPLVAPVNPKMLRNTRIIQSEPVSPYLFTRQEYSDEYYELDQPEIGYSNQLNNNKAIFEMPLQIDNKTKDFIRTQDIMVTPYNYIKYNYKPSEC